MIYFWLKVAVGALLAVNFSLPLYTVVRDRSLWDEPMAVLAANLSLYGVLFGLGQIVIGMYDLLELWPWDFCLFLQYSGLGIAIAFKTGALCLAVDQAVAVIHPLYYYSVMARYLRRLLLSTACLWVGNTVLLLTAASTNLPTVAEVIHSHGNDTTIISSGCRWENAVAQELMPLMEAQLSLPSLATTGVFIYTGFVGSKMLAASARLRIIYPTHQQFLDNLSAFKIIAYTVSLTLVLDIAGIVLRIASHWLPISSRLLAFFHQARLFGFLLEGWVYGLSNRNLRTAYKKTFCRCCQSHGTNRATPVEHVDQATSSAPYPQPIRIFVVPAQNVPEEP